MYQQFFNLKTAPFTIAPDPRFIYMSAHHQEGLAHLLYGVKQGGGFVTLTGEVGTGKTMLCHCLLQKLPKNIDIALVLNPKLNALELLATICDELNIPYNHRQLSLKALIDNLNKHLLIAHASRKRTILMIDEAQNLSLNVLEQIRLLTNLETSRSKLLQIILIGQPELREFLQKPELRQLNQRITARYHLTALSSSDTGKYIRHRIQVCGGDPDVFSPSASKRVYKYSKGIPRLINILCDRSLLGAYVANSHTISAKTVNKAAKEALNLPDKTTKKWLRNASFILPLVLITGFLLFNWWSKDQENNPVILSGSLTSSAIAKSKSLSNLKTLSIDQKQQYTDFKKTVIESKTSLNIAIQRLAKLWGKDKLQAAGCKGIELTGLRCLLDKTDWSGLIALNRPLIMEFSFNGTERFYALLLGTRAGNPVFYFNSTVSFSLQQVLQEWDGYYLMLWQSPIKSVDYVYPGQTSEAVLWIRQQLFSKTTIQKSQVNPAFFDGLLKGEVIKFQLQHKITPDGIVGPKTFVHLLNINSQHNTPKLEITR